jgi:hypothetical protein
MACVCTDASQVLLAYISYLGAQAAYMSGIVSILFCGMVSAMLVVLITCGGSEQTAVGRLSGTTFLHQAGLHLLTCRVMLTLCWCHVMVCCCCRQVMSQYVRPNLTPLSEVGRMYVHVCGRPVNAHTNHMLACCATAQIALLCCPALPCCTTMCISPPPTGRPSKPLSS